jgi:metallo-beta-lactamase class B
MKWRFVADFILVWIICFGIAAAQGLESEKIKISPDIEAVQLSRHVWLYSASTTLPGYEGPVSGNGLVVVSGASAMLVDLAWNDEQTRQVAKWISGKFEAVLEYAVPTHAHSDCAGGLGAAHELGAESWALHKTTVKLYDLGSPIPKKSFTDKKTLYCGDLEVELMYPGGGHTDDNIVAWIPEEKVLFAGCLVKAKTAANLGNTSEADLKAYPDTLKKVMNEFKDAKIVVPGHGQPGGRELIKHTIDLCKKQKK